MTKLDFQWISISNFSICRKEKTSFTFSRSSQFNKYLPILNFSCPSEEILLHVNKSRMMHTLILIYIRTYIYIHLLILSSWCGDELSRGDHGLFVDLSSKRSFVLSFCGETWGLNCIREVSYLEAELKADSNILTLR